MRSTVRRIADGPGEVFDFIAEFRQATVVADVEPLVAAWDSAAAEVERPAARFAEKLTAAMPLTLRPLVLAVGDQVVTDGLLAVRLRAAFIHSIADDRSPRWPRLQALIGKPVARIAFRPSPDSRHDR